VGSQCVYKWRRNYITILKELKEAKKLVEKIDKRITGNKGNKSMLGVQFHSPSLNSSTILSSLKSLATLPKQLYYLKLIFFL